MPVHFLPVQEPDFPALTRLFLEAFEKDPLLGRLKRDLAEPVRYEETLKYFLQLWGQRYLYGGRFWKAVEMDEDEGRGGADGRMGYMISFLLAVVDPELLEFFFSLFEFLSLVRISISGT